jgi:hypothetical protein
MKRIDLFFDKYISREDLTEVAAGFAIVVGMFGTYYLAMVIFS